MITRRSRIHVTETTVDERCHAGQEHRPSLTLLIVGKGALDQGRHVAMSDHNPKERNGSYTLAEISSDTWMAKGSVSDVHVDEAQPYSKLITWAGDSRDCLVILSSNGCSFGKSIWKSSDNSNRTSSPSRYLAIHHRQQAQYHQGI